MFLNEGLHTGNFVNNKLNVFGDLTSRQPDFCGKLRIIRHYTGYLIVIHKHGVCRRVRTIAGVSVLIRVSKKEAKECFET